MKKITSILFAALLLTAYSAQAQTIIDNTTLSATITATQTIITVGSVTCTGCTFGADSLIYVDTEAMRVAQSYVSGTTVPVRRGTDGTKPRAHNTTAVVYLGPATRFYNSDPPMSSCTRSTVAYLPWINITTGWAWTCYAKVGQTSVQVWSAMVPFAITGDSRPTAFYQPLRHQPQSMMAEIVGWWRDAFRY